MTLKQYQDGLRHDAERTKASLVHYIAIIRSAMNRLERDLDGDLVNLTINSLGVLQGSGVELDRLCGVFDARLSAYRDSLQVK